jgi:hypothetical protein
MDRRGSSEVSAIGLAIPPPASKAKKKEQRALIVLKRIVGYVMTGEVIYRKGK